MDILCNMVIFKLFVCDERQKEKGFILINEDLKEA